MTRSKFRTNELLFELSLCRSNIAMFTNIGFSFDSPLNEVMWKKMAFCGAKVVKNDS